MPERHFALVFNSELSSQSARCLLNTQSHQKKNLLRRESQSKESPVIPTEPDATGRIRSSELGIMLKTGTFHFRGRGQLCWYWYLCSQFMHCVYPSHCLKSAPHKIRGCDWSGWLLSCKTLLTDLSHEHHHGWRHLGQEGCVRLAKYIVTQRRCMDSNLFQFKQFFAICTRHMSEFWGLLSHL